jgi:hypothetical protein
MKSEKEREQGHGSLRCCAIATKLDLRRFRGLFQTENSARKGEQCHERTRPTHRSFAEKLSGW